MIPIDKEPFEAGDVLENCCFCRTPTPFWYRPKDVAVCPSCAKIHNASEVPTKAEWIKKEQELTPKTYREIHDSR